MKYGRSRGDLIFLRGSKDPRAAYCPSHLFLWFILSETGRSDRLESGSHDYGTILVEDL